MSGPAGSMPKKVAGYDIGKMQNFTPQQMELFQSLFGQLGQGSYLSRLAGGDEEIFGQIEKPAYRKFEQQMGQLGSRFSGMGMGARRGSGFNIAGTQAGQEFQEGLASQRQQLSRQAMMDLFNMSNMLLGQKPYEQFLVEPNKKKSFLEQMLSGGLPIAGAAAGGFFGGVPGAQAGLAAGSAASKAFM